MSATYPAIDSIKAAFAKVTSGEVDTEWVTPTSPPGDTMNQFLFFFKPEATTASIDYIMKLGLDILQSHGVTFGACRVVGGPYLDKHNIMVQHYGVISKISKFGYEVISDDAKAALNAQFADDVKECGLPVGGHQWLEKNPEFNPLSLTTINDNVGTKRLAGGTYLCKFKLLGKNQLVLNPFHAYQLVPYVRKGGALILFECRSNLSWADLRTKLCGATNPEKADAGSVRAELLKNKAATGMVAVNLSSNGVHMSAGPLEGMVELQRFLSDWDSGKMVDFTSLAFGARLAGLGLTHDQILALASNPDVQHEGKNVSTFDLTEEKNADESAGLLKATVGSLSK
jgi:hypothetical protein